MKAKDKFYLCLEFSQGGQAFDRTSVIPVLLGQKKGSSTLPEVISKAAPGERGWDGKDWIDFYTYKFENPKHNQSANFCMKVLAMNANGKPTPRLVAPSVDKKSTLNLQFNAPSFERSDY